MPASLLFVSTFLDEYGHSFPEIASQGFRNDQKFGLNAVLLFSHGNAMQYLEGESDAVEAAYRRICTNTEHFGVRLLERWSHPLPCVSGYHLGIGRAHLGMASGLPQDLPYFKLSPEAIERVMAPRVARDILRNFAEINH